MTLTEFFSSLIDPDVAWEEGVLGKRGFTRFAKSISIDDNDVVKQLIEFTIKKICNGKNKIK